MKGLLLDSLVFVVTLYPGWGCTFVVIFFWPVHGKCNDWGWAELLYRQNLDPTVLPKYQLRFIKYESMKPIGAGFRKPSTVRDSAQLNGGFTLYRII